MLIGFWLCLYGECRGGVGNRLVGSRQGFLGFYCLVEIGGGGDCTQDPDFRVVRLRRLASRWE